MSVSADDYDLLRTEVGAAGWARNVVVAEGPDTARFLQGQVTQGIERLAEGDAAWTIPAETGLVPHSVDFAKGCYVGQELVVRIDSPGGNVPRHLRGLRSTGDTAIAVGAEIRSGDRGLAW